MKSDVSIRGCGQDRDTCCLLTGWLGLIGALLLGGLAPMTASQAQNPFIIDGDVPDAGVSFFDDPQGNTKELSPENGSDTKIGPINTAVVPMLDLTNPNPQVDLTGVYVDSAVAANGDIWLYFFWERDSNNGSGFIALEVGENAAPVACDFSGATSTATLIANCNPWANRTSGDALFLWDQQGGSLTIIKRTFNGVSFDAGTMLNPDQAVAAIGVNTFDGELAVNLSATVFEPGVCENVANILPSTVTGNSDTADYKDTVFFPVEPISNCGTVIIRKQTDPDATAGSFEFTHNLDTEDPDPVSPFMLEDDGVNTTLNVFVNDVSTPYSVTESDPTSAGFDLTDIDCSASNTLVTPTEDLSTRTASFVLGANETVDCTFVNRARGSITIVKNAIPDDDQSFTYSGDLGAFALQDNGDEGDGVASSLTTDDLTPGTYVVSETVSAGWDLTGLSCSDASDASGASSTSLTTATATINLNAGEAVTCTYSNTKRGRITLTKTDDADNVLAGVTFSLYLDNAPTGGSRGGEDTDTGLDCTTNASGQCSFENLVPRAYWVVEDAAPSGYTGMADQSVTVGAGGTVTLNLENPRLHKVIVIVCHQGTDTLAASDVTNGSGSLTTLATGAGLPGGITEAQLCSLQGFTDKPHGSKSLTVNVGSDAH